MSPTLLSRRLKQLEAAGVLERVRDDSGVAYELTPAGAELQPLVESMAQWGSRWVRRRLSHDDLDAGLLMWDIRRQVDASRFPAQRVVVHFSFPDAPSGQRHWWLLSIPQITHWDNKKRLRRRQQGFPGQTLGEVTIKGVILISCLP